MKYKAKQLSTGQWAVFQGKQYFTALVFDTEHDAKVAALEESGRWYLNQVDKVEAELDKLGALNHSDPRGYAA